MARHWCNTCEGYHDDGQCAVVVTAKLHDRVRATLQQHYGEVPTEKLASALSYELVSIIATYAPNLREGLAALDDIYHVMRAQMIRGGVGRPHP